MDRSVLNKATSADEVPTPGYLYTEIAKATFIDLAACQQLADYLLNKLQRDNPYVKVKVLRIIRHVCDQGKPDFRRAVQKKADVVKACLQYRGTPDTLKGDAPNKAVREEADAAIKSVFSSDSSTNAYGMSTDSGKKMQGFGSDESSDVSSRIGNLPSSGGASFGNSSFGAGGGGGGFSGFSGPKSFGSQGPGPAGGSGMVGFGNPNFDNAPKPESESYLKSAMTGTFSAVQKMASKVPYMSSVTSSSDMQNDPGNMSTYRAPPAPGAGGGGGGWGQGPSYNNNMGGGGGFGGGGFGGGGGGFGTGVNGRWGADAPQPARSGVSTHTQSGEYEARLVAEICAPGGPRVAPSQNTLKEFTRKCESLDASAMGDQLRQKLGSRDWQTRLKALCAVEACSQEGLDGITGHICQYSSELLFEAQDMPQCRQKAQKVLVALGFIDEVAEAPARHPEESGQAALAQPAPAMDLLDMDDGPPATESTEKPPANGLGDLLEAAPATATAPNGGYLQPATAAGGCGGGYVPPGPGGGYMPPGGGPEMMMAGTAQGALEPAPPAVVAGGGPVGGGGLFSSLSVRTDAPPPPAEVASAPMQTGADTGGMFSNLQLGGASSAAAPPVGATPTSPTLGHAHANSMPGGAAGALSMPGQGMMPSGPGTPQQANRTAHLSILTAGAAGGHPMMGGLGAPGWPQQQQQQFPGVPPPYSAQGHPGMMMQQPYPGQGMPGAMGGMPGTMGMPGAMGMPAMGMAPSGCGSMGMQAQHPPGANGGIGGGPGSAFGFISPGAPGGGGAAAMVGQPSAVPMGQLGATMGQVAPLKGSTSPEQPKGADSAFGFVAEQMKGATA